MTLEGVELDEFVFSSVLKACSGLRCLVIGQQIHGHIVKLGMDLDNSAGTPIVGFYFKCGRLEEALKAFKRISLPNKFSSNPNRIMDSISLQAQPPKFNGSTSHLGAAACIGPSIFTGFIQKRTLKPRKMSLITISSSPQQLAPKCSSERGDAATSSNGVGGTLSDACGGKFLQVVLVSPQIPGNLGCIARTCAAALVGLHLIEPLGFQVADAKLKRAGIGLHYWPYVVVKIHASWEDFKGHFRQQDGKKRLLAFTKRGQTIHSDFSYRQGDWLVFGSETSGLSPKVLVDCRNEAFLEEQFEFQ
ncbi:tRNA/rRNA methyltransferase [Cinnamomum micranthum f. kanehirae]|uniref:tRNA/rRNA methyltransferase n=1 Tax=Cinnamomum micranthum f. kanehirae TaxID=337451 RepID=A0A3S4NIU2_9MAGN|nr:tRNA/rRNA methyltransferase [Cinnamomum micranthum f. kanehirae]